MNFQKKNRTPFTIILGATLVIALGRCGPIASSIDKSKHADEAANELAAQSNSTLETSSPAASVQLTATAPDSTSLDTNVITQTLNINDSNNVDAYKSFRAKGSATISFTDKFYPESVSSNSFIVTYHQKEMLETFDLTKIKLKLAQNTDGSWTIALDELNPDFQAFLTKNLDAIIIVFSGRTLIAPATAPTQAPTQAPAPNPTSSS